MKGLKKILIAQNNKNKCSLKGTRIRKSSIPSLHPQVVVKKHSQKLSIGNFLKNLEGISSGCQWNGGREDTHGTNQLSLGVCFVATAIDPECRVITTLCVPAQSVS